MRITKLLALAAVVVFAAACNGISPTSPNNAAVTSDDPAALVGAQALKEVPTPLGCRDITRVELRVLRSPGGTRVEAIYFHRDATVQCKIAPQWSSRPRGRITRTRNPFVVNVTLTRPPSTVQVSAQAPNGVQGSILVR